MLVFLLSFFMVGVISGWLSGMLGIGGGVIVVPLTILILQHIPGIPQAEVMHVAVGSSLAAMIVTATMSVRTRSRLGLIDWQIIKLLVPGVIVGVIGGALLASCLHSNVLELILAIVLLLIAAYMFFAPSPKTGHKKLKWQTTYIAAIIIGFKSGLLGLGGGAIIIPYLIMCGVNMRIASGAAAACTLPVAIVGTIMYAYLGHNVTNVPHAIGYIYLPAFFGIAIASVMFVPLGLKVSQRIKTKLLKRIFAVFLFIVAIEML